MCAFAAGGGCLKWFNHHICIRPLQTSRRYQLLWPIVKITTNDSSSELLKLWRCWGFISTLEYISIYNIELALHSSEIYGISKKNNSHDWGFVRMNSTVNRHRTVSFWLLWSILSLFSVALTFKGKTKALAIELGFSWFYHVCLYSTHRYGDNKSVSLVVLLSFMLLFLLISWNENCVRMN